MTPVRPVIRITLRWWLKPYIRTLLFFCVLFEQAPDWEKLERGIRRATKQTYALQKT